jgi:hypothetical protein
VSHDRPDAHELLQEVEHHLRERVLPAVQEEERFLVRVAANVVGIVAREVEPLAPDRAREAALAEEIRSGAWDERLEELAAQVREDVRAKVDVAHPGWSDLADDGR